MTAYEFVQSIEFPVVFYVSVGSPAGVTVAILEDTELPFAALGDTELPFALDDLTGEVTDGRFEWDGAAAPRDYLRNSVTRVTVYSDREEWQRQYDDWAASY